MKLRFEKGQVVYVKWLDSALKGIGWVHESDGLTAAAKEIETVGYVIDVAKDSVLIAGSRSSSGGVITPISIPLGCLISVKCIEV